MIARALSGLLTLAVLLAAVMGVWTVGPLLETKLWPVLDKITITKAEVVSPYQTRIWVRFRKKRQCVIIGVYWYKGSRDGLFESIRFAVEKPLPAAKGRAFYTRPVGWQNAGPWLMDTPLADLLDRSFADAQHECHKAWPTISHYYDGQTKEQIAQIEIIK